MSIVEDYLETAIVERTEDDSQNNEHPVARISFGTFILRVPVPSDN